MKRVELILFFVWWKSGWDFEGKVYKNGKKSFVCRIKTVGIYGD